MFLIAFFNVNIGCLPMPIGILNHNRSNSETLARIIYNSVKIFYINPEDIDYYTLHNEARQIHSNQTLRPRTALILPFNQHSTEQG